MTAKPIRGKLFQNGYVVRDIDQAVAAARERFGIQNWFVKRMPPGGILSAIGFAWVDDFMWELLEADPDAEDPIFREFLPPSPRDMRINHVGYMLASQPELHTVMRQYEAAGIGTALHMDLPDVLECYYADTRDQLGHYTEYVYMKPGGDYFGQAPHN